MIRKSLLAIFLVIAISGLYARYDYVQKLNSGYCFAEQRYLENEELYESVLKALYLRLEDEYQTMTPENQIKAIHYNSLQQLRENNPDCCQDSLSSNFWKRKDMQPYWKDKGVGFFFTGNLLIHLDKQPFLSTLNKELRGSASIKITSCGVVRSIDISNSNYYSKLGDTYGS